MEPCSPVAQRGRASRPCLPAAEVQPGRASRPRLPATQAGPCRTTVATSGPDMRARTLRAGVGTISARIASGAATTERDPRWRTILRPANPRDVGLTSPRMHRLPDGAMQPGRAARWCQPAAPAGRASRPPTTPPGRAARKCSPVAQKGGRMRRGWSVVARNVTRLVVPAPVSRRDAPGATIRPPGRGR